MSKHFANANAEGVRGEEYLIVVRASALSAEVEDAIRTGCQLIHDVATNEGVEISLDAGRVDREVTYVPSPSLTSHHILSSHDNGVIVRSRRAADDTIYVKE